MEQREQTGGRPTASEKAARVDLSEFADALSSGIVQALERRSRAGIDRDDWMRPWWVWAGWIIGTNGPGGPIVGDGPFGGGTSGGGIERPGG
jgi:hypothetical protein